MKRHLFLLLILLGAKCAWAQTPQTRYLGYSTYVDYDSAIVMAANQDGIVCASDPDYGLTEFNPDGTLLYTESFTQIPTFGNVFVEAVAVDASGDCYLAGRGTIVPTPGAYQSLARSMFLAELNPQGQAIFATYLGGSGPDTASGIALDASGDIWVTGSTASNDFPTVNAIQSIFQGGSDDAFIAELNPNGTQLLFATYLGGSGNEGAVGIAIDGNGDAVVAGTTTSTNFPTHNPLEATLGGANDGFITRVTAAGQLQYSTYFGGASDADIYDVATDSSGEIIVSGIATGPNFPLVNPLAGQQPPNFVSKLNSAGSALVFSTYFGDGAQPGSQALQVDAQGNVYFGGILISGARGITLLNPIQSTPTSYYVAAVDSSGNLVFSSFYGSTALGQPVFLSLGLDSSANLYALGITNFTTEVPLLNALSGQYYPYFDDEVIPQAFIGKLVLGSGPSFAMPASLAQFPLTNVGTSYSFQPVITLYNTGTTNIDISNIATTGDFSQTNNCPATLVPASDCAVTVTFTPTAPGLRTGSVVISDDSPGNPHSIQLSGTAQAPTVVLYPTSVNFGSQAVNIPSKAQVVQLSISCCITLTINQISISGDYSETNRCGTILNVGVGCSIYITFTPTTTGTRNGTLTITDSLGVQTVPLTGVGTLSLDLRADPNTGNSETVTAGQDTDYKLLIGGGGLSGTATLACSGAPAGVTCSLPGSITVDATTPTMFQVNISTASRSSATLHLQHYSWFWAFALLGIVAMPSQRTRRFRRRLGGMVSVLLILFITSCGGGGGGDPVPAARRPAHTT